eukprot:TRINITY_DN80_c0_g7_i2.p1 TRINITY_DN80_c0_g7~~TRINITY_DN80_c0_g7_i2.p1  ORF type:complete len:426 (+),score=106.82 TRINITY_DN80_c0_g7_i2:100-1377(+)
MNALGSVRSNSTSKHNPVKRSRKSRPSSDAVPSSSDIVPSSPAQELIISSELGTDGFPTREKREEKPLGRSQGGSTKGKETDHLSPREIDRRKSLIERLSGSREEKGTNRRKKECGSGEKKLEEINEGEGKKNKEREVKQHHDQNQNETKNTCITESPAIVPIEDVKIPSDIQWIPRTFDEIPTTVLSSALEFIPKEKIENNLQIFFHVAWFTYSKEFPPNFQVYTRTKPLEPYCLPHQFDLATQLIAIPPEKLKKMYKNMDFENKGGFGKVFSCRDTRTKIRYAIKKLPHETLEEEEANLSEIFFLYECKHPNIVEAFHFFLSNESKKEGKELWVVMEFMQGGTLGEAAVATDLCDDHIAFVAGEMAKGLSYLHKRNFVHRDVKSGLTTPTDRPTDTQPTNQPTDQKQTTNQETNNQETKQPNK